MEPQATELPVLVAQTGPLNGQRWTITQSLIIGRDASCDIMIPDRSVSRFHVRVTCQENGVLLEDLASKNGTYRNGERITEPVLLLDSDVVQVAIVQHFVFLSSDATVPIDERTTEALPSAGRLFLDDRSRRVWIGQQELVPPLSGPQFRLIKTLYDQQGEVVSRSDLILAVWDAEEAMGVSEQALDALIRRLRDRLNSLDPDNEYIITVRGHGLRLENTSLLDGE
ncbi:MAG: FHA domain-containing protein [Anaerolineaceae bacterium]|nr:FHA domain-containing protein [Anaerolineaceae bacterium]